MIVVPDREADFVIGPPEDPYMRRWWLIPRNDTFNIYLHEILHDDDDRALHDHPWDSFSLVLEGLIEEATIETIDGSLADVRTTYRAGDTIFRPAAKPHRLILLDGLPAYTLFVAGPRIRDWGFHCPQGWRPWQQFVSARNAGEVVIGCD